jgi:hypothetical protein
VTLFLLTVAPLASAGAASAGGPTSVLVSVPGEGRVAALYHTDVAYQALEELSGPVDAEGGAADAHRPRPGTGDVVTLTWLIHDVQVWRMDQVHLGGSGGPWVETRQVLDGGSVWDEPATWHRADPQLPGLVDEVLEHGRAAALAQPPPTDAEAPATIPTEPAPVAPVASVDGARSPVTTAAWSGGALLTGALAGTVVTWLAMRRRELEDDDVPESEHPATADQLAWP